MSWFGRAAVGVLVLIFGAPLGWLLLQGSAVDAALWQHLWRTTLPHSLGQTLQLALGVALGSLILGVSCAWGVTRFRFWGRDLLRIGLLLPLAFPGYLLAYVYTDLLDSAGSLQIALRRFWQLNPGQTLWIPNIRSLGGGIVCLSLALYPYVYLLGRTAFASSRGSLLEAAQLAGCGRWKRFWRLHLPLARPYLAAAVALVLMETLGDLGTAEYFGITTLGVSIYRVWLGLGDLSAAVQIALLLLAITLLALLLERWARRRQRYASAEHHANPGTTDTATTTDVLPLHGWRAAAMFLLCGLPVWIGFVLPCAALLHWSVQTLGDGPLGEGSLRDGASLEDSAGALLSAMQSTLLISGGTMLLGVGVALCLAYALRLEKTRRWFRLSVRFSALGYAIPGTVLALALLHTFALIERLTQWFAAEPLPSVLTGTLWGLALALTIRFLALPLGILEAGWQRILPQMDDSARLLGASPGKVLRRVHVPLLKPSLLAALVLLFIEATKELPLTLVLRPLEVQTLSTYVYQFASDERFAASAPAALCMIFLGTFAVLLLEKLWQQQPPTQR